MAKYFLIKTVDQPQPTTPAASVSGNFNSMNNYELWIMKVCKYFDYLILVGYANGSDYALHLYRGKITFKTIFVFK